MDNIEIGPIGNLNWDIPTKPRLSVTDKTWGLGQSWATNKTQSAGHLPHESIQFVGKTQTNTLKLLRLSELVIRFRHDHGRLVFFTSFKIAGKTM